MVLCLGQVVITAGLMAKVSESCEFEKFVRSSLSRHTTGDWGDLSEEDKLYNQYALENGDRIFSAYEYEDTKIWIITEWDHSSTTILFPSEY